MAGRLIENGSASSSTVASPSARRRTIERRVGSDKAANTTSNRSGAVTGIAALPAVRTSQVCYLTERVSAVKGAPEYPDAGGPSRTFATPTADDAVRPVQRKLALLTLLWVSSGVGERVG